MDKLIQLVLEEVALEGREGCTFDSLCSEVDKGECQGWTPMTADTKQYLLHLLLTENPGGHLSYFRRSDNPGTLPSAKYLVKEKGFVYYPISEVDNAEGSLYDVKRTQLTSEQALELARSTDPGERARLILMASKELRVQRLTGHCINSGELYEFEMCILEAVARTRARGLPKRSVAVLSGKQHRNVHHHIRSLQDKGLVTMRQVAKQRQLYLPAYSTGLQDDDWHLKLMSKCLEDRSEIGLACVEASTLRSDFGRAIIYNAKRTQAVRNKWGVEPAKDAVHNRRYIQRAYQKFVSRLETLGNLKIFVLVDDQNRQQKWVKLLRPYSGEDMGADGDRGLTEPSAAGAMGTSELRDDISSLRQIYRWIDDAGPAGLPQSQITLRTGMSFKWVERLKAVLVQNYGVGAKFAQNLQNVLISPRFANEGENLANIERRQIQKITYSKDTAWQAVGSLLQGPCRCKVCNTEITEMEDKFTCAQCADFYVCERCFTKNPDVHSGALAVAGEHHARDHIMLSTLPMARKFVKMRLDINIGGLQGDCLDFVTEKLKTEEVINAAVLLEQFPKLERYHYLRLVTMTHAQQRALLTCVAVKYMTSKTACIRKCILLRRLDTPVDTPKTRALLAAFVAKINAGERTMAAMTAAQAARKQDYPMLRIGDLHMGIGVSGADLVDRRSKSWMHSYVGSHMGRALLLHAYMWKFVYGNEVAEHMRRELQRAKEKKATEHLRQKEELLKQKRVEMELAAQNNEDHAALTAQARNSQYRFFKTRNRKRTKVAVEDGDNRYEHYNDPYSSWPEEYLWLRAAHDVKVDVPTVPPTNEEIGTSNYKCDLELSKLINHMPIHLFCEVVGVWKDVEGLKDMLEDKFQRLTPMRHLPPAMRELIIPNLGNNREVMTRLLDVLDTLKTMRLLETIRAPTHPATVRPVFTGYRTGTQLLKPAQLPPASRYDVFRMCNNAYLEVPQSDIPPEHDPLTVHPITTTNIKKTKECNTDDTVMGEAGSEQDFSDLAGEQPRTDQTAQGESPADADTLLRGTDHLPSESSATSESNEKEPMYRLDYTFDSLEGLYSYWGELHMMSEKATTLTKPNKAAMSKVTSVGGLPLSLRLNLPGDINPWKGKTSINSGKLNILRSELRRFKKNRSGWAGPQYHLGYAWCTLMSEWVVNLHLLRVLYSHIERGVLPKDSSLSALPETMRKTPIEKAYKKRKQTRARQRSTVPTWLRSRFSNRRYNRKTSKNLHDLATRMPDEFMDPTVVDARLVSSSHWVIDNFGFRTQFKVDDRVFTWAENEFIVMCNTVRRYGGLRNGSAAYYKTLKSAFLLAGFYFPYENEAGRLQKQAVWLDNTEEIRHFQKVILMRLKIEAKSHPDWPTECQRAIYHKDGSIMNKMVKAIRGVACSTFKGVCPQSPHITETSDISDLPANNTSPISQPDESVPTDMPMDLDAMTDSRTTSNKQPESTITAMIVTPKKSLPTGAKSAWASECVTESAPLHFGRNSNVWLGKLDAIQREVYHTRTRYMGVLVPADDSSHAQQPIHSDVATMGLLLTSQLYQWTKLTQEGKSIEDAPLCNLPAYWMQHCMDMFSVVKDQFKTMHAGMRQHSVISDHNALVIIFRRMINPEFRPNFFHLIRLTAQSFDDVGSLSLNTSNTGMGRNHSGFTAAVFSFAEDVMTGRATINVIECAKMVDDGDTHCAGDFDGTVEGHRRTMSEIMPIRCSMQYVEPDLSETATQVAQRAYELVPYLTQSWTDASGVGNGIRMCGHADGECNESCAEHALLAECAKAPMGVSHVCLRTWIAEVGIASSTDGVYDPDLGDSVDLYLLNLVMRGALLRVGVTEPMYVHPHHAGIWATCPVTYVDPAEPAEVSNREKQVVGEEGSASYEAAVEGQPQQYSSTDIQMEREGTAGTEGDGGVEIGGGSGQTPVEAEGVDDVVQIDRNGSRVRTRRRQPRQTGKKQAQAASQKNNTQPTPKEQQESSSQQQEEKHQETQDASSGAQYATHNMEGESMSLVDTTKTAKKPPKDAFKIDSTRVRVIDPWISPSPEKCINTERLGKFLTVITERVLHAPWINEGDLYSDFRYIMFPRAFKDLLQLLVKGRVIKRNYLPQVRKPDLFSSPLDTLLPYAGCEKTHREAQEDTTQSDKIIYNATTDCYVRLAYLLEAGGCAEE